MRLGFENVAVMSIAHAEAPIRLESSQIEDRLEDTFKRIGVRKGLLQGLSGIFARRMWPEGVMPSDAATLAAQKAIDMAGVDPKRLGVLVNTSVCRDFIEPSTACLDHGNLSLPPECMNFDIGNACLGFLNGMDLVGNMIERGQIDYGLIVDGESSSYVVEQTIQRIMSPDCDEQTFRDNFATLTLGSGGAAMVLCRKDLVDNPHHLVGSVSLAATQHNRLCQGQVDGMKTDTKQLLFAGIELAHQTLQKAKRELDWSPENLDHLVLHQVSKVHTEQLANTLGLSLDKVLAIYPEYGNIGPASVPFVLSKLAESGRVESGDRIALMGIGSGLNCTMTEIRW